MPRDSLGERWQLLCVHLGACRRDWQTPRLDDVHVRHGVGGTRRERRRDGGHPNNDGTRFDQVKPPRVVELPEPIPQPSRARNTESGTMVPRFQLPSEREVGALLYLTHTISDRHETRLSPEVERRRAPSVSLKSCSEESFSTLLTHFGNVYARGSRYIIILTTCDQCLKYMCRGGHQRDWGGKWEDREM